MMRVHCTILNRTEIKLIDVCVCVCVCRLFKGLHIRLASGHL